MPGRTWPFPVIPASGTTNFETTTRNNLEQLTTSAAAVDKEVVDARGNHVSLAERLSTALDANGSPLAPLAVPAWTLQTGATRINATTFTVTGGDRTGVLKAGRALMFSGSTNAFARVVSSSFASNTTSVTVDASIPSDSASFYYATQEIENLSQPPILREVTLVTPKVSGALDVSTPADLLLFPSLGNFLLRFGGKLVSGANTSAATPAGGLTLEKNTSGHILVFKETGLTHGITNYASTNTFGSFGPIGTQGGATFQGVSAFDNAFDLIGIATTGDTNPNGGGSPIRVFGYKKSGTGAAAFASNEAIFRVYNYGTCRLTLTGDGSLYLTGYGAGTLSTDSSGRLTTSSDARLKQIVGEFPHGLEAVEALHPVLFRWKPESGHETATVYAGFLAQEVQEVIPEAVGQNPDGTLTLQDRPILAALVKANQELSQKVHSLESRLAQLEARLQAFAPLSQ